MGSKTLHTPFSTFLIFGHPTFLFGSRSARALLTRLTIAAEERSSTLSRFLRIKKYLVFFLMAVGSCCQNKTKIQKCLNIDKILSNSPLRGFKVSRLRIWTRKISQMYDLESKHWFSQKLSKNVFVWPWNHSYGGTPVSENRFWP